MYVIKKDGRKQVYDPNKIIIAINKSADRALYTFTDKEIQKILELVTTQLHSMQDEVSVLTMHSLVENALDEVAPTVAKSYRDYRNFKNEYANMMDRVNMEANRIQFLGDRENSNADSTLVSTKRTLIMNALNKELYIKFQLNQDEVQAINEGYIYIHDMSARRDTMNCCLFRLGNVLSGGFEMSNMWYNEPKSIDTAFDVTGDIILMAASQQYGGFTVPEIDTILAPYAKKSYEKYLEEFRTVAAQLHTEGTDEAAAAYAKSKTIRDIEQGYQGIEYKLNTVASSRGDYPFITFSFGIDTSEWGREISKAILRVHKGGQGKEGFKHAVLFPKLVFLYDKNLHSPGCINEDVFDEGIQCSAKTMYPDWLSLTGEGYIADMYKTYHKVISPMGCRAFLSPYWEKGGQDKAGDDDIPVFQGRFNIGAISLHLPMILAKSREENRSFYEVLDYYMEMIRRIHCRTYEYLGHMKASCNPLAYCQGGFLGGHLDYDDRIAPLLDSATASFGITALNELQQLYNQKSLVEDGAFALEVMEYINKKIQQYKAEDHHLYAIYGTPAESLCGKQIKQFRKKYGIIKNVSDREYVSNSFHCHVTENISPIQKQDLEHRFWELFNGGKIQYVRYNLGYNMNAIRTLVRRAMDMGFYEGVNLALSYCDDCGYEQLDMDVCPKCGSKNVTKIDRMNGYLSFSRVRGASRLNDAKMAEIKERKSM